MVNKTPQPRRARRTAAEMNYLRQVMLAIAERNQPQNVRNLFYSMVSAGAIPKDEREYKGLVVRLCLELRQKGKLPWEWVVDDTRFCFSPTVYGSHKDYCFDGALSYRQSLWETADMDVEVWVESLSSAGVVKPVTWQWAVPLYPTRGAGSHAYLREAGREMARKSKATKVFILADYDSSGLMIADFTQRMLLRYARELNPDVSISCEVLGVTPVQIREWKLPWHAAKREGNPHYAKHPIDECVELEAISPPVLRKLVEDAILQYLDSSEVERLKGIEEAEKDTLFEIAKHGFKRKR
jgi:hypothetical protein